MIVKCIIMILFPYQDYDFIDIDNNPSKSVYNNLTIIHTIEITAWKKNQ